MTKKFQKTSTFVAGAVSVTMAVMMTCAGALTAAQAAEADAKGLLKAMSDYLARQKTISLGYDANFEIVTPDHQKLLLANSGTLNLRRPDNIRATRSAGFTNTDMVFDGKTLTMFSKDSNVYIQVDAPGTIEHLIDELRDKFQKPLPGADLLLPNVYDVLMEDVTDVKDLGSGVIGGTECDHLAFRTKELDWQIWIAQGNRPYPCRYIITSKQVDQAPQYSIQIRDWKTGDEVAPDDFNFKAPKDAKKMDPKDLKDAKFADELPGNFSAGGAK
jgi:hypothetical protein